MIMISEDKLRMLLDVFADKVEDPETFSYVDAVNNFIEECKRS